MIKFKIRYYSFVFNCWLNRKVLRNNIISVTYSQNMRAIGKSYYINKLAKKHNGIIISPYSNMSYDKNIITISPSAFLNKRGLRPKPKCILIDEGCSKEQIKEILLRYGDKVLIGYC